MARGSRPTRSLTRAIPRAARSLVFASGLRSPFRFSLDPAPACRSLATLVIGHDGGGRLDPARILLRLAVLGGLRADTGYKDLPECTRVATTKPVWEYPHGGSGAAVTGASSTPEPPTLRPTEGATSSGTTSTGRCGPWVLPTGALTTAPERVASEWTSGPPSASPRSGWGHRLADICAARLRRLVYAPGNAAPVASFTSKADASTRTVTFDATGLPRPERRLLSYKMGLRGRDRSDRSLRRHTATPPIRTTTR